jgi:hypothetical protein
VTRAGAGGNPLSPAWGYWLYIAALMLCWLALGLTKKGFSPPQAAGFQPKR